MTGIYNARNSVEIDVQKLKDTSKKQGCNLNEFMLAITSKVLKDYFNTKKDESKSVSFAFPVTFKSIPEDPSQYRYHNMFGSTTLYVKLTD